MLFDYTFRNNLNWTFNAKFMNAPEANYVDFGGSNISEATEEDGLFLDVRKMPIPDWWKVDVPGCTLER